MPWFKISLIAGQIPSNIGKSISKADLPIIKAVKFLTF